MTYPLDCFSWLANANLAAFSCSLANLFSYLLTFFSVGLMNLPFMSDTEMVSSLICRSRRITSRCRKNISPSSPYHLSKYSWQIFFRSSMEADSNSALLPHLGFALLLLLQLLRSLLSEEGTQLLLPLGGHESLLLSHGDRELVGVGRSMKQGAPP